MEKLASVEYYIRNSLGDPTWTATIPVLSCGEVVLALESVVSPIDLSTVDGQKFYALLIFVCALDSLGIYPARPPTTIDNYLSNFAQNTPLRIYRSKYWHTHA